MALYSLLGKKTLHNDKIACNGCVIMDKEEILEKSRRQKEDEGTVYAENKGRRYGFLAFDGVFVFSLLFNQFTNQDSLIPWCMFAAYSAAEDYGRYRVTKSKLQIAGCVISGVCSVFFLVFYVMKVLGIAWTMVWG